MELHDQTAAAHELVAVIVLDGLKQASTASTLIWDGNALNQFGMSSIPAPKSLSRGIEAAARGSFHSTSSAPPSEAAGTWRRASADDGSSSGAHASRNAVMCSSETSGT